MIPISEMFVSPQGEGLKTGLMSLFVRVAGCNLAIKGNPCVWCDTDYAWFESQSGISYDTINGLRRAIDDKMIRHRLSEICLTGGEPLMYGRLMKELISDLSSIYNLTVETNGSYPIWSSNAVWSLDIKCPFSGNMNSNYYPNLGILEDKDQVKFIVANNEDLNFASSISKISGSKNIIFQPACGQMEYSHLINWIKEERETGIRVGTQCHKVWYPDVNRGV